MEAKGGCSPVEQQEADRLSKVVDEGDWVLNQEVYNSLLLHPSIQGRKPNLDAFASATSSKVPEAYYSLNQGPGCLGCDAFAHPWGEARARYVDARSTPAQAAGKERGTTSKGQGGGCLPHLGMIEGCPNVLNATTTSDVWCGVSAHRHLGVRWGASKCRAICWECLGFRVQTNLKQFFVTNATGVVISNFWLDWDKYPGSTAHKALILSGTFDCFYSLLLLYVWVVLPIEYSNYQMYMEFAFFYIIAPVCQVICIMSPIGAGLDPFWAGIGNVLTPGLLGHNGRMELVQSARGFRKEAL
ncbi:hypothetical protein CEUSTIGMA_g11631.t1 [Chlamydomonas eustigma]|uniref:Uncharacterized protein n=1 Tax=Chlamydomonas eustigma TaxID=1157962 RepID=A0A250XMB2_9CHLO|nr:hypothetical protein CEUSTIGMA_g11631.t1 [Chlamydomonas eustigma]|eukprot:GAX84208.1 hypothetical protein CEUSTIGMA_g11631.t1 [Chlamydomonas eustigma]